MGIVRDCKCDVNKPSSPHYKFKDTTFINYLHATLTNQNNPHGWILC